MCGPNENEEIVSDKKSKSQLVESAGAMDVIMNLRQTGSAIPRQWIILDSASSPDIFYAEELVKDITKSDTPLKVLSRGGTTKIDKECTLPGYPSQVWFDTNGVANIIGLRNLIRYYAVTYDSSGGNRFHVWKDDKAVMTFQPWEGGLNYTSEQISFSFLTTVEDNKKKYTPKGVKQAEAARRLQDIVMRPPSKKLQNVLARGFIRNCPMESRHVQFADDIYGRTLAQLRARQCAER
jgi:hypothetical protein